MTGAPVDVRPTSSGVAARSGSREVALRAGLLPGVVFGTNAGIPGRVRWVQHLPLITTTPAFERTTAIGSVVDEVRDLRDEICAHGLTKQNVARAVGVDRRSLSGWVSGQIRPSPDRVRVLRTLARLVADIAVEHPGRVREVLLDRRSGIALIDRVARDGQRLLRTWRAASWPEPKVSLRPIRSAEPIWAAAARALADGTLTPPTWARIVRPAATYEMDLEEASAFEEPEPELRRRSYR